MTAPLVSIVTPSFGRPQFLESCYRGIRAQSYANWEWLVLDDSPQPSSFMQKLEAPNVSYTHSATRMTIGEKRNWLIERANGAIVLQFDDDDYYAPSYAETMIAEMDRNGADIINLSSWFLLDMRNQFFGYWDLTQKAGPAFACSPAGVEPIVPDPELIRSLLLSHLGFGFTYVFRKAVWEAVRYPAKDWNEDGEFMVAARKRFKMAGIQDRQGLSLHIIHRGNTSQCFPQYRLPYFLLKSVFADFPSGDYMPE